MITKHAIVVVPGIKIKIVDGVEKKLASNGHEIDDFINKLGMFPVSILGTRFKYKVYIEIRKFKNTLICFDE